MLHEEICQWTRIISEIVSNMSIFHLYFLLSDLDYRLLRSTATLQVYRLLITYIV